MSTGERAVSVGRVRPDLGLVAASARAAARLAFAGTIVLSPFRARIELLARPSPPVYGDFTDFLLFWSDIALLLTLGLWLVSLVAQPRPVSLGPRFLALPLAGILVVAWLGVPFATDAPLAAYQATRLVVLATLAVYVLNETGPATQLLLPIGAMVAVQAIVGLGQIVVQHSLGLPSLGELHLVPSLPVSVVTATDGTRILRAYGLADHPNILGGVLAFGVLLAAGAFAGATGRFRWLSLAIFAFGSAALLVTFSRGAWLAAAAGLLVIGIMLGGVRGRAAVRSLLSLSLAGAIACAPVAVAFLPALAARTDTQGPIATETRSIDERVVLASATLDVLVRHPLLGVAIGTLPEAIRAEQPDFQHDYQPSSVVLLDVAAETGLVGGLLYLVVLVAPWVALGRLRRAWTPALAVASGLLAAVSVVGLFDYYTWTYQAGRIWAWLALGIWAAAYRGAHLRSADAA